MIVEFNRNSVSEHCENFVQGINYIKEYSLPQALLKFQMAYDEIPYGDIYHNKYASYCGLARVLNGDRAGVELCRDAARQEMVDGDVFLNLAFAEWHLKSRKRSIGVLEKGLSIDSKHPGLTRFQCHIGKRAQPVLFFIPRNNIFNKVLGKIVHKKNTDESKLSYQWLL